MGLREDFVAAVASRINFPYRWGARGPEEFDCCGLVEWGMVQIGHPFERDLCAADLYSRFHSNKVLEPAARPGSLWLYSNTGAPDAITHVMIMHRRWANGGAMLIGARGGGHTTTDTEKAWQHRAYVDCVMADYWHNHLVFIVDPFLQEET